MHLVQRVRVWFGSGNGRLRKVLAVVAPILTGHGIVLTAVLGSIDFYEQITKW